jgi:hypothetical protein
MICLVEPKLSVLAQSIAAQKNYVPLWHKAIAKAKGVIYDFSFSDSRSNRYFCKVFQEITNVAMS